MASSSSSLESKDMDVEPLAEYTLSAQLTEHHQKPLRDAAVPSSDVVALCEERGRFHIWERKGPCAFSHKDVLHDNVHTGTLTFCVEAVPSGFPGFKDQTFMSGGNDQAARIWTINGTMLGMLKGHRDCVNSITFWKNEVITGCWDGVVRFYKGGNLTHKFDGHKHATEVLAMRTGILASASTEGFIQLHDLETKKLIKKFKGHEHAVRKLILHPLGFASCGNDGFVKVWTSSGDQVMSIAAHTGSKKADHFVYGLTALPNGDMVSCGEDGFVRVWGSDGKAKQNIRHPGPVRSVKALPNGDFITLCTDRGARIFTSDVNRVASDDVLAQWESLVNLAVASHMETIDVEDLPGKEALGVPGGKDGAIKVIAESGKAVVYKWNALESQWAFVGEAMGKAPKKTLVDGEEWDVATDVYVTDSIKHQLYFNRDEEPEVVAKRFVAKYKLPQYTIPQIIEHVTPLVDAAAIARRKQVESKTALKQVPAWQSGQHVIFSNIKVAAMSKKLMQYQSELKDSADAGLALSDNEITALRGLIGILSDPSTYHTTSVLAAQVDTVRKLFQWPLDKLAPVFDLFRVLMVHQDAVRKVGKAADVHQLVLARMVEAQDASAAIFSLYLKAMANWIAKRIRTAPERRADASIPADLEQLVADVVDACGAAASHPKTSVRSSYVSFAHNLVVWLGKMNQRDSQVYPVLVSALFEIVCKSADLKPQTVFYALLTIASMGYVSPSTKQLILQNYKDQLTQSMSSVKDSTAPALKQLHSDLCKVFKLT